MSLAAGFASIAVCDRCNFKVSYQTLRADGNSSGLRVCPECWDPKDPWRLPPMRPDSLSLKYPRPDTPLWPIADHPPPIIYWDEVGIFWDDGVTRWS